MDYCIDRCHILSVRIFSVVSPMMRSKDGIVFVEVNQHLTWSFPRASALAPAGQTPVTFSLWRISFLSCCDTRFLGGKPPTVGEPRRQELHGVDMGEPGWAQLFSESPMEKVSPRGPPDTKDIHSSEEYQHHPTGDGMSWSFLSFYLK